MEGGERKRIRMDDNDKHIRLRVGVSDVWLVVYIGSAVVGRYGMGKRVSRAE